LAAVVLEAMVEHLVVQMVLIQYFQVLHPQVAVEAALGLGRVIPAGLVAVVEEITVPEVPVLLIKVTPGVLVALS
jgi:hypothetical protein